MGSSAEKSMCKGPKSLKAIVLYGCPNQRPLSTNRNFEEHMEIPCAVRFFLLGMVLHVLETPDADHSTQNCSDSVHPFCKRSQG